MSLISLIILGVALYSAMLILLSQASGKIDSYWSATIFGITSTMTPLAMWLLDRHAKKPQLPTTMTGIIVSLVAGLVAGLFTASLVRIFAKGDVSFATPAIYGGAMAVVTLIGWLVFKETITGLQAAGIALTFAGVALIVFSKLHGAAA